jgi:hypothetical protein
MMDVQRIFAVAVLLLSVNSIAFAYPDPNAIQAIKCNSENAKKSDLIMETKRTGNNQFNISVKMTFPIVQDITFASQAEWSGHFWVFQDGRYPTNDSSYAAGFRTYETGGNGLAFFIQGVSGPVEVPLNCNLTN